MPTRTNAWIWPRLRKPKTPAELTAHLDYNMVLLQQAINEIADRRGAKVITQAAYTVQASDYALFCDSTAGAQTITLPPAATVVGQQFQIKRINGGANSVTVDAAGTELIDNALTLVLSAQYTGALLHAYQNGSTFGWWVVASDIFVAAGGGEANTGSNVGTAGVGVFDGKVGVDLQFRKLNPLSTRLSIALDAGNKKVDLDVVSAQILLQNLGGRLVDAQIEDNPTNSLLGRSLPGSGVLSPQTAGAGLLLTGGVLTAVGTGGTATLDFGASGATDASIAVTGQAGILAGSKVLVSVPALASVDHSADEHIVEAFDVYAGSIIAGTGFTIYGMSRALGDAVIAGRWNVSWLWF